MSDRAARVALAKQSHYYFFHIYLSHYVKFKTAKFHQDIFAITEDEASKLDVVVAFRGSGKSTIMSLSYVMWALLGRQEKKFVLLLSQTQNQARQLLAHIKFELENNLLLINDFGARNLGIGEWSQDSITMGKHQARVMAASAEQSVRGLRHLQYRPDLIIADDVEDGNSTRSRDGRNKTYSWFKGEIIPAGDTHTKIVVIGNLLHEDSLLMRLKQAIEAGKQTGRYHHIPLMRCGSVKNNKRYCSLAWPGKYPNLNSIKSLERRVSDHVIWKREYMLELVPSFDQVIHHSWLRTYTAIPDQKDELAKYRTTVAAVDLAISEKETADYTSIVIADIFDYGEKMRIYIRRFPFNKRINFPAQREEVKTLSIQLQQKKIYVEDAGYQRALVQQLKSEGVYNVEEAKLDGKDKRSRLALTSYYIKNGIVLFPKEGCEELLAQITGFGVERHDDLADAFSLLILKIIEEHGGNSGPMSFGRSGPSDDSDMPCGGRDRCDNPMHWHGWDPGFWDRRW